MTSGYVENYDGSATLTRVNVECDRYNGERTLLFRAQDAEYKSLIRLDFLHRVENFRSTVP